MGFDRRLWLVYLSVGGIGFFFYLFPLSAVSESILLASSCGLSAVAVGLGMRMFRPRPAIGWLLVLLGQILNTFGDLFFAETYYIGDRAVPVQWSEVIYFLGALCFLSGLVFFFVHFRQLISRDAFINGVILALALVASSLILRANPLIDLQPFSPAWLDFVAYPVIMLVILVAASIFLMTGFADAWSYRLLFVSILSYAVGQFFYGKVLAWGSAPFGAGPDFNWATITNLVFSLAYYFLGLALLHPSAKIFKGEIPAQPRRGFRMDLLVLGIAFWLIPLAFVYCYTLGQPIDISFVIGSMLVMFALIQSRLALLFRVLEKQNTQLKQQKILLQYQAYHDALTGLPNRTYLHEYLGDAVYRARANGSQGAVFMIDFNRFKNVNDLFGHDQGDQALLEISRQLADHKRKTDFVARWGGDEFVFVLENLEGREDALAAAQRLSQDVGFTIEQMGQAVHVSISVGVCMFPDGTSDQEALIRQADQALLHAKTLPEEKIYLK